MPKINMVTIATLKPTGKRQFIRDSVLVGFGIEGSAKGKFTYFVETRVKGTSKNVRTQIGNVEHISLDEAKQEARTLLLEAKSGHDIRFRDDEEDTTPETIGAALEEFFAAKKHKLAVNTVKDYKATFSNCLSDWKDLPTKQLSRRMVQKRFVELLGTKNPPYVSKVFRNLSTILSYSGVRPNPCEVIKDKDLSVPTASRSRFLSGDEIYHVMQWHFTFRPKVTPLILFYMMTGVRREEALKLTWGDIQGDRIMFRSTKNHKDHAIPLVGALKELVGKRKPDNEKVFPFTNSQLRTALTKFKAQLDFKEDWTIHDLRRTFSEHMNLIGYSEFDIAIANNQSSGTVTRSHYLQGQLAKESLLKRMFTDLQLQYDYYYRDHGGEVQKVPKGWMLPEIDMIDLE